jgi:NTP pyrophosphatase (non-canonical NTP hydrolase)
VDINVNSYHSSYSEVVTKYEKDDKFTQFKYPEKLEDVPGVILLLARLMEQLYQEIGEKFEKKKKREKKKKKRY